MAAHRSVLTAFAIAATLLFLAQLTTALSTDSIAVVGAGFSGLSTAYHLVKSGYTNITIFEATDRVDGFVTSFPYKKVTHDLSTYGITQAYWRYIAAMEALGSRFCRFSAGVADTSTDPATAIPIGTFVQKLMAAAVASNPSLLIPALIAQTARYTAVWRDLFDIDYIDVNLRTSRLFPSLPKNQSKLDALALPMKQFLKRYGLELLTPVFIYIADTEANGPIATTPALYYLTWVPPGVLANPIFLTPCDSMQAQADRLAVSLSPHVNIHLDTNVTGVQRLWGGVAPSFGSARPRSVFDRVIITGQFGKRGVRAQRVRPVLSEEAGAFDTLEELSVASALFETRRADAMPTSDLITFDGAALARPRPDVQFYSVLSHELRESFVRPNAFAGTSNTSREVLLYFNEERARGERVEGGVRDYVPALRRALGRWDRARWEFVFGRFYKGYFQRWRSAGVRKGLPWAIDRVQGRSGVYYVTAAACGMESVWNLFDCAKHLVDEHFGSNIEGAWDRPVQPSV